MVTYQQKCIRCRKNWVTVSRNQRYPVCYECEKAELGGVIKDPKMKRMFNLPLEFYKKSGFLRDIKINYIKYGKLTEKQVDAFKKTVKRMKENERDKKGKGHSCNNRQGIHASWNLS